MTAKDFRRIALQLPGAIEGAHMAHPDFRINKKIFASLHADGVWGVVMLTPEQQQDLIADAADTFKPAAGAWGRKGCTMVLLEKVDKKTLEVAIKTAWENKAPRV